MAIDLTEVSPGAELLYVGGHFSYRCRAVVEVIEAVVTAKVKIITIIDQGEDSHKHVGQEIVAGAFELYSMPH